MTQYLISFNEGTMNIPLEELAEVSRASMAVIHDARAAGVYVAAGGLVHPDETAIVAVDGTVTDAPNPAYRDFLGGFTLVNVATRADALHWAARLAASCRCPQDVRELMGEPNA